MRHSSSKLKHTTLDWLDLHELTSEEALKYCDLISVKYQPGTSISDIRDNTDGLIFDLDQSLEYLILPSINDLLHTPHDFIDALSRVKVIRYKPGEIKLPYTEWCAETNIPIVHLIWSGKPQDLVCLAHEMAHAAQMMLSRGKFMPPVAREVCAFLAELALIQFVKEQSNTLYQKLCAVWHHENQRYLGSNVAQLAADLRAGLSLYTYWHNYPLARVAAIHLFGTTLPEGRSDFFASGSAVMERLNFPEIFEALGQSCEEKSFAVLSGFGEEALELCMSLSPQALNDVRTGEIDCAWLDRSASAGCVVGGRVGESTHFSPQHWIKWRSLGVLALVALKRGEAHLLPGAFLDKFEQTAEQPPELAYAFTKPWMLTKKFDALTAIGIAIQQLAASSYHEKFNLSYYLPVEILPPLLAGQLRCYLDVEGNPAGLTTWAWLSDKQKRDIHKTGRALKREEWSGGIHPFVNDWITVPAAFRAVMTEKRDVIFPNHIVSSLRRNRDASIRRVNKWAGRNLQKKAMSSNVHLVRTLKEVSV
ncbi:RTX toxin acyltransferase family protein [Pseudovibrio axinellae]|uniref:RTX toxin-activating lysine-acyltransferase n=1 Tax=Pseudovibrio axinellae TaxID=989403 RepID=A0A165X0E2_9HYPH|nr:toxin-activating lysine-acyltransferase [Pseudovibrio axinellae]KZL17210.1 RTX toxin acyltransferase family protein [Pseudovibrio axinellae]SER82178.1 ACP:hemolysin acyltransferase (hemolysin-activating protein) [Pseudovibrio axinellae]